MPLYEFRCPNGHDFEKFYRSIGTSSSEALCPVCGAVGARLISTAGLVFKGSGFYITDYGKDGKKAERDAVTAEKAKDAAAAAKTEQAASAGAAGSDAAAAEKPKPAEAAPAPAAVADTKASPAKPAAKPKSSE